jgi:hypothetical protein
MIIPGKYSIGLGDRFGHQGGAQLKAVIEAGRHGIDITPVWNKSNREHIIIGTHPGEVRLEADLAAKKAGFTLPYFVDADHIHYDTVDSFISASDFFTIDVANQIGQEADKRDVELFMKKSGSYTGTLVIPGIPGPYKITKTYLVDLSARYLSAAKKAGEIYRKIERIKGKGRFITEISMDEVSEPQKPVEIFFILMMLGLENIPVQTIAPKFSGRFNKGVDYAGNPDLFAHEFEENLLVINKAIKEFRLPETLKMSIHSGSDKFSIYPHMGRILRKHEKGVHLKTAGTTWLEEVIGLAMSGGESLSFVKEIYSEALEKTDELCAPYADVIDINKASLPKAVQVMNWDKNRFSGAIRHIPGSSEYNPDMRQLIHVAYKLAASRKDEFYKLLDKNKDIVEKCVFENIYDRHIKRLFDTGKS